MRRTSELAARVLKDNETFTMRKNGTVAGLRWWMPGWIRALAVSMLSMDEPDHTGCAASSTKPSVAAPFSTWSRGFSPSPMSLRLSFLPRAVRPTWSSAMRASCRSRSSVSCSVCQAPTGPGSSPGRNSLTRLTGMVSFLRMIAGIGPMKRYLEGRLQAARDTGGEGLIAELVRVEKEGGRISRQEMVAMVFLLLGAGSETTTHLISGSVYELLRAPELRDWLEEDWSRAPLAVEEFLRFVSPVQFTKPRFVRRDIELGGVRLKQGDRIMAMLAAANMDRRARHRNEDVVLPQRQSRLGWTVAAPAATGRTRRRPGRSSRPPAPWARSGSP